MERPNEEEISNDFDFTSFSIRNNEEIPNEFDFTSFATSVVLGFAAGMGSPFIPGMFTGLAIGSRFNEISGPSEWPCKNILRQYLQCLEVKNTAECNELLKALENCDDKN